MLIVGSSPCSFPAANKDWLRGRRSAMRFFYIRLEVSQIQIAYTSSMLTLTIMSFVNCSLYVYLSMELREDIAHCCVAMGLCEMREEFKRPGSTGEVCIRNVGATKIAITAIIWRVLVTDLIALTSCNVVLVSHMSQLSPLGHYL